MLNRTRPLARLFLLLLIALCAHAAHAQTTLRMWTLLDPNSNDPRSAVMNKLIKKFEDQNPGVKVVVERQVWSQLSMKFLAAHSAGNPPDITWVHIPDIPLAIQRGALADLNKLFIDKWPEQEKTDMDGTFWRYASSDKGRYFIAFARTYNGILYRSDLLAQAGIEPAQLTTWDKFNAAAQKLTARDSTGAVTRWGFGQAFGRNEAMVQAAFSMMLNKQKDVFDDQCRAVWSTEAGISSMRAQTAMVKDQKISPPAVVSWTLEDVYDQFAAGRLVFIRGTSARMTKTQSLLGADKVGFMLVPGVAEGKLGRSEINGWGVAVSSKSPNQALAGKFVEFISNPEADKLWTFEGGSLPMRHSTIASDPSFFGKQEYAYMKTAARGIDEYGWLAPENCVASGMKEDMNRIMQSILTNDVDVATAVKRGEDEFNRRRNVR